MSERVLRKLPCQFIFWLIALNLFGGRLISKEDSGEGVLYESLCRQEKNRTCCPWLDTGAHLVNVCHTSVNAGTPSKEIPFICLSGIFGPFPKKSLPVNHL